MTTISEHPPDPGGERRGSRPTNVDRSPVARPTATLLIASAGTLLVLLVFASVVTTIGPTIESLRGGLNGQTWALGAMSLGLATTLLSLGAISDDYGRRRLFVLSCLALAGFSALTALAPNIELFVIGRVAQGAAGAGILAAGLGLIGHAFPRGVARTHATGVWGAAVGAGTATGPAVSAALIAVGSWRTGYWLQAATAAVLVPFGLTLAETRAPRPKAVDLPGAALFASAMGCLTAGLTLGRSHWGRASTVAFLTTSVVLLIVFVAVERQRRDAMIDVELFRRPLFIASASGALFTGLAVVAVVSFMPSLLQRVLHQSPLACAGILGIWSVTGTVVAYHVRRLPPGLDSSQRLAIGFVCGAIGMAAISGLSPHSSWLRLAPGLLALGVGYGLVNAALGRLAVESVPVGREGMGSGANNTARYVGGAAGIAVVAALIAAGDDRPGPIGLAHGWTLATVVAAGLCMAGAALAIACRRAHTVP